MGSTRGDVRFLGYIGTHPPAAAASRTPLMRPAEDAAAVSDEALADRLRRRDLAALEALHDRHARALFSLALVMLEDQEAAEEVVRETLLTLWRRPDRYDPRRGRLPSWLLAMVHHHCVDRLRSRSSGSGGTAEPATARPDREAAGVASWRDAAVARALDGLPQAQRLAVELAYVRGLTHAEIDEALGEPPGTGKTHLRLAMQELRASLRRAEPRPDAP